METFLRCYNVEMLLCLLESGYSHLSFCDIPRLTLAFRIAPLQYSLSLWASVCVRFLNSVQMSPELAAFQFCLCLRLFQILKYIFTGPSITPNKRQKTRSKPSFLVQKQGLST